MTDADDFRDRPVKSQSMPSKLLSKSVGSDTSKSQTSSSKSRKSKKNNLKSESSGKLTLNKSEGSARSISQKVESEVEAPTDNEALSDQLSPEQVAAFEEVKRRHVESAQLSESYSDENLLKFLYGKKFEVDKALDAIKNHASWYAKLENGLNISMAKKFLLKNLLVDPGTTCKDGRTIFIFRCSHFFPAEFSNTELSHALMYFFEKILERKNTQLKGVTVIYEMTGYGYQNFSMSASNVITDTAQNRVPMRVGLILAVNVPFLANAIYSLVRPMLSKKLQSRLKFIPEESLLDYIDPEALPDFYKGGLLKHDQERYVQELCEEEGFDF